jgi:acetyl-CoA C-acetyltransferase
LPVTTSGTTIDRQCSSGLQAIALASYRVQNEGAKVTVGGGVECISLVQSPEGDDLNKEDWLTEHKPSIWMSMIDTAETVARRYGIAAIGRTGSPQKASAATPPPSIDGPSPKRSCP